MYAGLNDEEKSVLKEVTSMGMNPQGWYGYKRMGLHGFLVLYQSIKQMIPDYFKDFWTTSGYLGYDHPELFKEAKIIKGDNNQSSNFQCGSSKHGVGGAYNRIGTGNCRCRLEKIGGTGEGMPVAFQLGDEIKTKTFLCGDLVIKSGAAKGASLMLTKVDGDKVVLGPTASEILVKVKPGDTVIVDNSNLLAVETLHWHRCQDKSIRFGISSVMPKAIRCIRSSRCSWDPFLPKSAAGVLPTGKFRGKMILLGSHGS